MSREESNKLNCDNQVHDQALQLINRDKLKFKPAKCDVFVHEKDNIEHLKLRIGNQIVNLNGRANMHLVQVHRNRQTTIRTAISPQPKCRVYLHFGLRKEEQRRFVELLTNNKISTDAQEENHIAVIHNSDKVLKQKRSNEEKKNLQKLMSMYSNGRPMLNTISKLRSESSTPINMCEDSSKISEVKSDSKNLPAIAISPIHNRSQFYPNICVDDSFNSKSTFNSEAHEHRKKIIEGLITDKEIRQIRNKIHSQFKRNKQISCS